MKKAGTGMLLLLALGAYVAYKKWWAPGAAAPAPAITDETVSPLLQPMAQTSKTVAAATQFAAKAVDDMTGKSDWGAWT